MIAINIFELPQEGDQGDSLDGLTKSHLICKDAVDASLVKTYHPVEAV